MLPTKEFNLNLNKINKLKVKEQGNIYNINRKHQKAVVIILVWDKADLKTKLYSKQKYIEMDISQRYKGQSIKKMHVC